MSDLFKLIIEGENKFIELKSKYSKSLLKTVSAFSNYHDGKIIIGVTDQGEIIGVDNPHEMRLSIENAINDNVRPNPCFEIQHWKVDHHVILILSVYKGYQTPYVVDQKAYKRSDTSTVSISKYEYDELVLLGRNLSFEELEYTGNALTFNKLSKILADKLSIFETNDDVLKSLELIKKGKFTNAAALMADENVSIYGGTDFVCYLDQKLLMIKDRVSLKSVSILETFETAMDFYRKHMNQGSIIKGAYREEVMDVPEEAYREAIANAIIHRDYSRNGNNRVEIFEDRIEITSVGSLPVGISYEEFSSGSLSIARNRIISDIFLRCRIVEKLGTGVRRMKAAYVSYNQKPEFRIYENCVQVILPRIQHAYLIRENNENDLLTHDETKLLNYLKASNGIDRIEVENYMGVGKTKATNLLNQLLSKKRIIKVGVGKNTVYKYRVRY